MKLLLTLLLFVPIVAFAQVPQGISYQAVARDVSGAIIPNQTISIRFTITDGNGGPQQYRETHTTTTNTFGLFSQTIGKGTVVAGTFASLSWGAIKPWLAVDMDPAGGSTFVSMGTSEMVTVPYAFVAGNAGTEVREKVGTATLLLDNTITTFSVIPGLSDTITVNANDNVEVFTHGAFTNSGSASAYVAVDLAIFVDGVNTSTPSYVRMVGSNLATLTGIPQYWSFARSLTLTPGMHIVQVRAVWNNASAPTIKASVSGSSGLVGQGLLKTTISGKR